MKFQPSTYSYGAEDAAKKSGEAEVPAEAGYEAYVPLVKEFFWGDDPREELAIIEAKIASYEKKVKSSSWPMNKFYEGELAKLKARRSALQQIASEMSRSVETTQLTKVVLIGLGVAGTLAVLGILGIQASRIRLMEAQRHTELRRA